jgi:hypothetical protein
VHPVIVPLIETAEGDKQLPDLPMSGRPLIQVMYVIDRTM